MKKIVTWMLILVMLLGAAGAASAAGEKKVDAVSGRGIVPQGAGEDGTWADNPVIEGENPVTGLPWEGYYMPILVNLDNIRAALPHFGILEADIVYEMPIDIRMTRLTALYATSYPNFVGPVRSVRTMHVDIRQEWGGPLVGAGGQGSGGLSFAARFADYGIRVGNRPEDGQYDVALNSMMWINVLHEPKYGRTNLKRKNPHNHAANLTALYHNLQANGIEAAPRPYLFTDELPDKGDDAEMIYHVYGSGFDCEFAYDAAANAYARRLTNYGNAFNDESHPGSVLAYSNVIVQWVPMRYYNNKTNCPELDEVGEGNADIFMGGKHISGYWVRTSYDDRTIFFDDEGNEIRLQRGKTWITLASPSFLEVSYR